MQKKVELQQCIDRKKRKCEEIRDNPEYDDGIREDIRKRIEKYNDQLKTRQESIDFLSDGLKGSDYKLQRDDCHGLEKGT